MVWYSFLIVSILTLLILTYIPMLTTIKYSFHDVEVLGYGDSRFVGMQNYKTIMSNASFLKSTANTLLLAVMSLISIPIGFILATLINNVHWGGGGYGFYG